MIYIVAVIMIYMIFLTLFSEMPLLAKIFVFAINFVLSDPVPYLDEVYMVLSIFNSIFKVTVFFEFIGDCIYKVSSFFRNIKYKIYSIFK